MLLCCFKFRKNAENKSPKFVKRKKWKFWKLVKKSKFIKEQKASGLLSSLGIKAPLFKNPLVGPLLF